MKNLLFTISLLIIVFTANNSFAQKSFEGTVKYAIEYDDLPEGMEGMEAMLPKESVMKIKGSKTRTEQSMGMGSTVSIYDADSKKSITLVDMMGKKVAIESDHSKNKETEKEPTIKYLNETKEIAGYKCKKAELTYGENNETITVYYTEEINTQKTKSQYKGLKGFPMQYEIENGGMSLTMTVKEIKKEKLSDSEFSVPKDYETMTQEEFEKMIKGQMGQN